MAFTVLEENHDQPYRLGRHVWQDPQRAVLDARNFFFGALELPTGKVEHIRRSDPWDQGSIGDCTANAALGCLMTDPFYVAGRNFTELDCVSLYEAESKLDDNEIPGEYPPDDTGSTGPWSMKALIQKGLIRSYHHAVDYVTALNLLKTAPISVGVTWYNSMFNADSNGLIKVDPSSGIAGGHQVCVVGFDASAQTIKICNSWGTGWGQGGYCYLSWADFDQLMRDGGDAVVPVL